jgi:hypothetical protein
MRAKFLIKHATTMTAADLHYFTYRLTLPIDFSRWWLHRLRSRFCVGLLLLAFPSGPSLSWERLVQTLQLSQDSTSAGI